MYRICNVCHTSPPFPWWPEHWNGVPAIPLDRVHELGSAMLEDLANYWLKHKPQRQLRQFSELNDFRSGVRGEHEDSRKDTCMKQCSTCIFLRETSPVSTKHTCAVLTATGFQQIYADHESRPQCVIMSEPESFRELLAQHLAWQMKKLDADFHNSGHWGYHFRKLAKTAQYLPLHPSIRPVFKIGDKVVIQERGFVRGVIVRFSSTTTAIVEHCSTTGRTITHSGFSTSNILHMRDFEFLRSNENFARKWFAECNQRNVPQQMRVLRAGIKR